MWLFASDKKNQCWKPENIRGYIVWQSVNCLAINQLITGEARFSNPDMHKKVIAYFLLTYLHSMLISNKHFFFNRKMLLQNLFYERYLLPWDKYLRRTFRKLVICLEFPNHQLVEFLILITFVLFFLDYTFHTRI